MPEDPDLVGGFTHETVDLIPTHASGKRSVLVLPTDEEHLEEDAFPVVNEDAVHDLETVI